MGVHGRKLTAPGSKRHHAGELMGRISRHLMLGLLLCTAFFDADAQESYVKEGATIKFQTDSGQLTHTAQLALLTRDSLFLQRCSTCSRLVYSRVEVSHLAVFHAEGRGDRFLTGWLIGTLAGGGLAYVEASTCTGGDKCDGGIVLVPAMAILGGLIGGIAGVLSGYKWHPITPDGG